MCLISRLCRADYGMNGNQDDMMDDMDGNDMDFDSKDEPPGDESGGGGPGGFRGGMRGRGMFR
jgi:hypothetical protein